MSPWASLILRPGFDRLAVPALARFYFPVSRLWAQALADPGDAVALLAQAPALGPRRARLARAVARVKARGAAYDLAESRWRAALFDGAGDMDPARAVALRAAAAEAMMSARAAFLPFVRAARLTPFGWRVPSPAEVEARHGARLADPALAFALPDAPPAVALSRAIARDGIETLWLRAPVRVAGEADTLWARVERPIVPAPGRPALVFTHGIAMETEFWRENSSVVDDLARAGITVIRPEGPWHGRRRRAGTFGGEPTLACAPLGMLDYFDAHVRELALLTGWARGQGAAAVAVGGVSLGALAAQMALSVARHWPAANRPDAGFLVTTSGSLMDVSMAGALTRAVGMPASLTRAGWDDAMLRRWLPLLEPDPAPPPAGPRVVALLGTADEVTPYASGRALMTAWGVPAENLFVVRRGHFSAALGLYRDRAPLKRLVDILRLAEAPRVG